jgi:hypothetical protein
MRLASKNPPVGPNCDARHDAPDILTDTSPAFPPLFAHGLWQRSPVNQVGTGSAQIRWSIAPNKRRVT